MFSVLLKYFKICFLLMLKYLYSLDWIGYKCCDENFVDGFCD